MSRPCVALRAGEASYSYLRLQKRRSIPPCRLLRIQTDADSMQPVLQIRDRAMRSLNRLLNLVIEIASLLAGLHRPVAKFFEVIDTIKDALIVLFAGHHGRRLAGLPFKFADAISKRVGNVVAGLAKLGCIAYMLVYLRQLLFCKIGLHGTLVVELDSSFASATAPAMPIPMAMEMAMEMAMPLQPRVCLSARIRPSSCRRLIPFVPTIPIAASLRLRARP